MAYGRRGGEIVVNSKLVGSQFWPSVAGFQSGGFIVVWTTADPLQDGAGFAIKAQRYDSLGNAIGTETLVNSSAAGDQRLPSVTTLASGGYVVTWETTDSTQDGSGRAIKGQLFDSSGAAVGSEFRVNTRSNMDQLNTSVTGLAGGGFLVAWETSDPTQDGNNNAIKGQIYSASGSAVGSEFLVNTGPVGHEHTPDVTSLSGGGFVATWTRGSGQDADIYAQVFAANGAKLGGQFLVSTTSIYNQDYASVSEISGGRFVVTWKNSISLTTGDSEIRARIFSSDGTALGNDFVVDTSRTDPGSGYLLFASQPKVQDLPGGGFVITWSPSSGGAYGSAVYAQFFDSSGARVGSEVLVSTVTNRFESDADVAVDGNGNMFAVWYSNHQSLNDPDIHGQFYGPAGAPEIVSNGGGDVVAISVLENQNAVTTVSAVDPDASGALVYSIIAGPDAARFAINASTGVLTFVSTPDFEARVDVTTNNIYDVVVSVSDGVMTDIQAIFVTVMNVNEAPTITTSQTSYFHRENGTAVATFSANDPDRTAVTWSIAGGPDAARFAIDPATGALRFVAAPNFEAPEDVGANNFYNVTIAASDGSLTDTRALTIEIANLNEGPVIVSGGGADTASFSVPENIGSITTILADDPDFQDSSFTYSIVGGADAALFTLLQNGSLLFKSNGRNFEVPTDADGNNVYEVIVAVSDGFNPADTQAISVTVTDANDAPVITSNGGSSSASVSIVENQAAVTTVAGTDADNQVLTYGIAGGADSALFAINARTGALSFLEAPDREAPRDAGANHVYNLTVSVSDGQKSATQALSITVLDSNEAPVIGSNGGGGTATISVAEGSTAVTTVAATDPEGKVVSFAIAGGADSSRFTIDSVTGALGFLTAPDREQPADSDGDNLYEVVVAATDGQMFNYQTVSVTVANVYEGISFGSPSAEFQMVENSSQVGSVAAVSRDGNLLTYAITGGADSALFSIDPETGALSFAAAADYEAPGDSTGSNSYSLVVTAGDGISSASQAVTVTVGDVEERVEIISGGGAESFAVTVAENGLAVTSVAAVDPDGRSIVYSIGGGADAHLFTIDAQTGEISFLDAANFETPADFDGDNVYDLLVSASDGASTDSQSVSVTVGNVDEPVELVSYGGSAVVALTSAENSFETGIVVQARDEEDSAVTYSITGGADGESFEIDAVTGALSFVGPNAPDFEDPTDFDSDNVHEVVVTARSSTSSAAQTFMISIVDGNDSPWIAGGRNLSVDEGRLEIATIDARDVDGDVLAYAIVGGADSALFAIDPATGLLTFIAARDYETPLSAAGTNVYTVEIEAGDGEASSRESFQVTVNDLNEGVSITSGGGGESAAFTVNENAVAVTTVAASDLDGDRVTYSIAGGADSLRFTIDAQTGVLSFVQAPDFDSPADAGADNVYDVVVSATDGAFTDSQSISVTVGNVDEPVEFVSFEGAAVVALDLMEDSFEVGTVEARDQERAAITYSITGGGDAHSFQIDAVTGALSFIEPNAPDFEDPTDFDFDNVHEVTVTASTSTSSATQTLMISITNRNEAPRLDEGPALLVDEGQIEVTTLSAYDRDADALAFGIVGGPDAALFTLDPVTGVLKFIDARDYEAPLSAAGTNVYTLEIEVSDGEYTSRRSFEVTIRNVNEGVSIISGEGSDSLAVTVLENAIAVTTIAASDADGDVVTYSIAGGADSSLFTIDPRTGALRFVQAPNFEAPADSNGDNVYDVIVSVTDGTFIDSQAVAVTVANRNEAVVITSNGGAAAASVAVSENGTAVATVTAGDPDGGTITYAIAGGADADRFRIDSTTGALAFVSAPNFEAPADAGANNVYDVIVSASDGSFTATQAIAVTVGNVNEGVSITSNGGGSGASVAVSENGTAVTKVVAVDLDGAAVTYAIAGGSDSARFTIDPVTGVLAFVSAPNFEARGDSNGDNVYDVLVSASDGSFTDTQAIAVAVTNVNEAPVITSNGGGTAGSVSIPENSAAVIVVAALDPDGTIPTYSIVGGADSARFRINAQTGALQFVEAPDWELPGDSDQDNVYAVIVRSSDGQLVDDQVLNVTVTNIRDGNTVSGTSGGDSISATSSNIALRTSNEEDLVFGRDGHDSIQGMAGADEIYGEDGNDSLVGGDGADKLAGGFGKDQFVYNAVSESTGEARDLIMDFSRSQGDKISLAAIDANSLASNNQAFTFIGTSAFSNVAGQLRYESSAGITTVFGDVNGDGIADLQIQLSGSMPLVASDFIL